jgi:hypothetical protein
MDKKSIRPQLNISSVNSSVEEKFQNETLRPIIKLQHSLLIQYFSNLISVQKIDFKSLKKEKKSELISEKLVKENPLKDFFKGLVSGQFTPEEFDYYLSNKNAINKRITQIIEKRLIDSMQEIETSKWIQS